MSSDQKFTTLTADGQVKTFSGGSTNIGPARVTYIQATGITNIKLAEAKREHLRNKIEDSEPQVSVAT